VFNWLKNLLGSSGSERRGRRIGRARVSGLDDLEVPAHSSGSASDELARDPMVRMHREYWTFKPEEKAELLSRYPDGLSWPEMLRLHHLSCLEMLSTEKGNKQFAATDSLELPEAPGGDAQDLCVELFGKLASDRSPYRPRHCLVWQGEPGQSDQRDPDMQGVMANASMTHLGSIEIIRIDENEHPQEVTFVPLDDIRGALFAGAGAFRGIRLFKEDGSDDIARAPLLYGVSWNAPNSYDRDGTMTRFCCSPGKEITGLCGGVGVGHQDLAVQAEDGGATLFGIGSVGEIMVALSVADPRFEEKCRGRGLDPDEVRKQVG
jgi:hypothetical protein